jgi:hypothetical protein
MVLNVCVSVYFVVAGLVFKTARNSLHCDALSEKGEDCWIVLRICVALHCHVGLKVFGSFFICTLHMQVPHVVSSRKLNIESECEKRHVFPHPCLGLRTIVAVFAEVVEPYYYMIT